MRWLFASQQLLVLLLLLLCSSNSNVLGSEDERNCTLTLSPGEMLANRLPRSLSAESWPLRVCLHSGTISAAALVLPAPADLPSPPADGTQPTLLLEGGCDATRDARAGSDSQKQRGARYRGGLTVIELDSSDANSTSSVIDAPGWSVRLSDALVAGSGALAIDAQQLDSTFDKSSA